MRIILLLWAVPLGLFWSWYALSANDISFGTVFLSRELHDLVFDIYGHSLGVPATDIPAMIAWACFVDTALIGAIAAWRWRAAWWPQAKTRLSEWIGNRAIGTDDDRRSDGTVAFTPVRVPAGQAALPDGPAHPAE
ncbi:MAG: DUF6105 family protein [Pseudomonadota bacterium]|nr:DUF6105 family protein [Pseudomonadota bacterium]